MSGYSYQGALEAAGAKVLQFESFGSYQGEWWAKVEYQGKTGWINGGYGSCSGCDSFQGEFGYSDMETTTDRLKQFGMDYLDGLMSDAAALRSASEHLEWDLDAQPMVDFIKQHSEPLPTVGGAVC